ncbi:anaphase-promoting complex subunit cdc27, partial [Coemansia furcata]
MCAYRAGQGLESFAGVGAAEQQNSAWGLCVLGRLCFEAGRYPEAARAFAAAHELAPYRVRDMDAYSTLLWHMRREEDLAQLAHALVRAGRSWSPEAWVAVANCFSLDGDHASAQRSLGRSIQLYAAGGVPRSDSGGVAGLAYAHTLVGHESVAAGDDAERAQQAFRTAMRIDARHYNAWYGLGMVYLRQARLDLAEYHLKRALALNTQNPLLLQSAGALLEARGDYAGALAVYERVLAVYARAPSSTSSVANEDDAAPHHALSFVLFKRARVLVVLERFADAAAVLRALLRRCPREFNVPFLLGQTYTRLRRFREAAACLTRALDIAPENAPSVREAFDALYHDEEQEQAEGADLLPLDREDSPLRGTSSSSSSVVESPDQLLAGGWGGDWRALSSADDRVARALDFDV